MKIIKKIFTLSLRYAGVKEKERKKAKAQSVRRSCCIQVIVSRRLPLHSITLRLSRGKNPGGRKERNSTDNRVRSATLHLPRFTDFSLVLTD
jgi:hypothetical protein